jgi:enamine deaminase RidA (YjgF/YER057c/UK114 family)
MKDVMKLTIFTTQMQSQNILNEISARYFGIENPPARSLIGVPTLAHPGMLIEIEGVAAAPAKAGRRVRAGDRLGNKSKHL